MVMKKNCQWIAHLVCICVFVCLIQTHWDFIGLCFQRICERLGWSSNAYTRRISKTWIHSWSYQQLLWSRWYQNFFWRKQIKTKDNVKRRESHRKKKINGVSFTCWRSHTKYGRNDWYGVTWGTRPWSSQPCTVSQIHSLFFLLFSLPPSLSLVFSFSFIQIVTENSLTDCSSSYGRFRSS
jgi:hypothetical protein